MPFVVDTQVPCGNTCGIDVRPGEVAEVRFTPDPHGGPEVLWFCFCLRSTGTDRVSRVRLILEHAHNMLGGHEPGHMRPVVRYAGQDWQRLGSPGVQELPDGRRRVSWEVDAPLSTMDVAYCYPYGQLDVDTLVRETHGYWKADAIGVSQGARPLVRLSNDYGHARGDRPGLYLIARQHSGETPGSWVLDGFMRRVAELGDRAPLVWAVPLAHIDGVVGGDYGKDGFPYDLNRAWGNPPMRHETLVYQRDVQRWIERCRPVLGIDFHAPGACETSGVYAYVPDPARHPDMHWSVLAWTTAIKSALGEYAADIFERVVDYPSRWKTPNFSRYLWERHDLCSLGIETPYALVRETVLTRAGARMADGIVRALRVRGCLA